MFLHLSYDGEGGGVRSASRREVRRARGVAVTGHPPDFRRAAVGGGKGTGRGGGARAHLEVHVGSLVQDLAEHRILLDEAPLAGAVLLHALAERLLLLVGPLRWSRRRNWSVSDRKSRETRRKGWGIGDYARTREAGKAGEGAYLGLRDAHDQRSGRATDSGGRAAPHTVEDPNRTWERILEAGKIGSRNVGSYRRVMSAQTSGHERPFTTPRFFFAFFMTELLCIDKADPKKHQKAVGPDPSMPTSQRDDRTRLRLQPQR